MGKMTAILLCNMSAARTSLLGGWRSRLCSERCILPHQLVNHDTGSDIRRRERGTCYSNSSHALAGSRLQRSAAEPDLVSVEIAVRDLAHAVRVGFPLHGVESPIGYLRDERIEVSDEERVHGVAGMLRPLHNIHVPMLRKLPHGLCVGWKECGRGAQQPFVPLQRRRVVGD